MMLSRRRFVHAISLAGAAGLAGPAWTQEDRPPLPVPPLLDAAAGPLQLEAQPGLARFGFGVPSVTAGYNGSFLGPTLRLHSGSDARIVVRNRLPEATTVHWHGLLVPAAVDGGPHNAIAAGGEWRPVLPVRQPAATAWYHAHPHMRTAQQVYAGLAGMLIVTDAQEQALGLPSRYGVDDLPLILQDRFFDRGGRMLYPHGPMTQMHGAFGNVLLVNGAPGPLARVPAALVRLRLLNAANARIFDLSFADGRGFQWIGTEGGLLREPVARKRLLLAPGQRAEVLVDFADGQPAVLGTQSAATLPARGADAIALQPLLHFAPQKDQAGVLRVPARLAQWDSLPESRVRRRRRLTMTMGMAGMGGMMGGMGAMDMSMGFDGQSFAMDRIDQQVKLGDVELWEVSSQPAMMMDMQHPFHMHGVHFEVLRRDGGPPAPQDAGRRDTVLVDAPVQLLVHFTQPAAATSPFMYHCHILEHEDAGMMGQFTVAP
jgi:FtsP/CotA-like multicopper oxidase with cupredoxin domain